MDTNKLSATFYKFTFHVCALFSYHSSVTSGNCALGMNWFHFSADSVVECGCDIFSNVPSDPEEEDDVVEFTFCADPQLFAYHLCLSPSKG